MCSWILLRAWTPSFVRPSKHSCAQITDGDREQAFFFRLTKKSHSALNWLGLVIYFNNASLFNRSISICSAPESRCRTRVLFPTCRGPKRNTLFFLNGRLIDLEIIFQLYRAKLKYQIKIVLEQDPVGANTGQDGGQVCRYLVIISLIESKSF